jgi:hypothetical protein
MMRAIDARVLSERMSESNLLGASGLSIKNISAEPEILISL